MGKIFSMTGFALHSNPYGNGMSCEIRSLNSRFLETNVKLPLTVKDLEDSIKDIIQKNVNRGRVTCSITFNASSQSLSNLKIDPNVVDLYKNLLNQIRKVAGIGEEVKLEHLLAFKGFLAAQFQPVAE